MNTIHYFNQINYSVSSGKFVYREVPDASVAPESQPKRAETYDALPNKLKLQDSQQAERDGLRLQIEMKKNPDLFKRYSDIQNRLKDMDGLQLSDLQRAKFASGLLRYRDDFSMDEAEEQPFLFVDVLKAYMQNPDNLNSYDVSTIAHFVNLDPRMDIDDELVRGGIIKKGQEIDLSNPDTLYKLRNLFNQKGFQELEADFN